MVPLLIHGLGCGGDTDPAADRSRYRKGLEDGACTLIVDPALRDDCWVVAAGRGQDQCVDVVAPRAAEECWFRLAEARSDASFCSQAGAFADSCALHVLSQGFFRWPEARGAQPGELEDAVATRIVSSGLAADDMRPWSAWYRYVIGGTRPFSRGGCRQITDAERQEACWNTGVAVYHDLLNHHRDTGRFPCDRSPLPLALQTPEDPELDAVRAARTDLCP